MNDRPNKVASALMAYEPSLRERIGDTAYDIANYLGMGNIADRLRGDIENVVDFVPFLGDAVGLNDAYREYNAGNYSQAATGLGLAALGAVPVVGDLASMGARRAFNYRDSHLAPIRGSGAPLYALDDVESAVYGSDIYDPILSRNYITSPEDRDILNIASQFRGNPDAMVDIYRATPLEVGEVSINPGDWVTLDRRYADLHGSSRFGGNYNVSTRQVPAREVYTSGDSLQEWGWSPEGYRHILTDQIRSPQQKTTSKRPDNIRKELRYNIPSIEDNITALTYIKDSGYDLNNAIRMLEERADKTILKSVANGYRDTIKYLQENRDKIEKVIESAKGT